MKKNITVKILTLIIAFLAGAHFSYTKYWPYHLLRQIGLGLITQVHGDGFYKEMFSEELIANDRLLPDISDRNAMIEAINSMTAPRVDIRDAGKNLNLTKRLTIRELSKDKLNLASIAYALDGRNVDVYAYQIKATKKPTYWPHNCAAVIIPGSGHNQSLTIAKHDTRNYHFGILKPYTSCDAFVLIKPNEDYLSIARDNKKLTENSYINHLIGIGSSYSSRYVIDAIALTLAIKKEYQNTIVTGLSQGGTAAILVGIETHPDITISASGLFEIFSDIGYGGFNSSLLFPGIQQEIFKHWMPKKLKTANNDYLIISGRNETGLSGQDAREGWTCSKLTNLIHVTCESHSGGHIYPYDVVTNYIINKSNSNK